MMYATGGVYCELAAESGTSQAEVAAVVLAELQTDAVPSAYTADTCPLMLTTSGSTGIPKVELQDLVGGDVFLHWYNEVKVGDAWLQVSPVFNKLLCKLYGIEPLEFDGYSSAIHQPFSGGLAMSYLDHPVVFTNPSYAELIDLVNTYHPRMVTPGGRIPQAKSTRAVL